MHIPIRTKSVLLFTVVTWDEFLFGRWVACCGELRKEVEKVWGSDGFDSEGRKNGFLSERVLMQLSL
jgi:hypothetical protein